MEQVNDYLSGNTVECLICGKRYQWLYNHIVKMHDTSPDDYRRRFGIPFTRSLTSAKFRAVCSARVAPQYNIEHLRLARASRTVPARRGPMRKGIPAVENLWKEIRERTGCLERAHAPITVPCVECGAAVATTVRYASLPMRCLKCTTPESRHSRLTYWRNKWKTIPPPLTPSELAQFDRPFQTIEEVDAYLAGETVACLICGHHKSTLSPHLRRAHNISSNEYRYRFGIPLSRALSGASHRAALAAAMTGERLEWFKGVSASMRERGLHKKAKRRAAGMPRRFPAA